MRALTWHGKSDIRCETVPDRAIQHPQSAIINRGRAPSGSNLRIYGGIIPSMKAAMSSATRP
jgi:hypothetical protein